MNYINILLSSSDFLFLVSEDKYTFARILQNDSLIFDSHFEVIISLCKLVWTLINSFKLSCWRCFVLSGCTRRYSRISATFWAERNLCRSFCGDWILSDFDASHAEWRFN